MFRRRLCGTSGWVCVQVFLDPLCRVLLKSQSLLKAYGILGYYRFRDDMLVLSDFSVDDARAEKFIRILQLKARKLGYIVNEEEAGAVVPFLDTQVSIDNGIVSVTAYVKPNAQYNVPLSRSSCHASHIHDSSPSAQVARNISISPIPTDIAAVAEKLRTRYVSNHIAVPNVVAEAADTPNASLTRFQKKPLVKLFKRPEGKQHPKAYWLVLPYHPVWKQAISKALSKLNADPEVGYFHRELSGDSRNPRCVQHG